MSGSPCRLFVYLARASSVGVVLRRGPSDWVRLSRWDTSDDTFEHGQWMRARVYERRCDVSPDGSLFVAFVRGAPDEPAPNRDSWVTLSRPPWFSALALWFVGGTYCAGGCFSGHNRLWLGFDPTHPDVGELPGWLSAESSRDGYIDHTNDWPDRTVWLNRLIRDGWSRLPDGDVEVWEHPEPNGSRTLRMTIQSSTAFDAYGGHFQLRYDVVDERNDLGASIGTASWADWDQGGRLVVARDGQLLHWMGGAKPIVLADFNHQSPDPQPSPEDAVTLPSPGSA